MDKKGKFNSFKKIMPYYRKNSKNFVLFLTFFVFAGILGMIAPIFSANALARLAEGNFNMAIQNAVIAACTTLLFNCLRFIGQIAYIKLDRDVRFLITDTFIRSINSVKMKKMDETTIGLYTERISSDIQTISNAYLEMMSMIFEVLVNVVFLVYVAFLNVYMFLVLVLYVAISYIIAYIGNKYWVKNQKTNKKLAENARSSYFEQIRGLRDVKLLNIGENITNHSNKLNREFLNFNKKIVLIRIGFWRLSFIVTGIFELVFLVLGIVLVRAELLMLAGLLVIYSYHGRVGNLVNYISSIKEYIAEGDVASKRVFEVIEDFEKEKYGTGVLKDFSGKVEFKNVEFAYNKNSKVLKGVNLTFDPSKMSAIVGASGSGKTTILSLISKLYDVSSGEILLDGKNLNDLSEESIKSNVGAISQTPYIFNTTIKQNLLFVKPDATDEELIEVLQKAQIWNDIKKLPNQLDSEIGENGIKLSGGQKQRLAIARLLLRDSKVIIFDEATSALDNNSQSRIVKILEKYKKNKTIIIVANRI